MKSILEMTALEARQYFLKQESYANFDLPPYFDFCTLLSAIDKELEGKVLKDILAKNENGSVVWPSSFEDVNHKLLNSKDGRYSWRPFQLIHPVLYVSLVHTLTEDANWKSIIERFEELHSDKKIQCLSLPKESTDETYSDTETTIFSWWNDIEQRSLELSLYYNYVVHTDVTNCYGNIYTHSIAWAINGKSLAKSRQWDQKLLGNQVDKMVQGMSHGQTNGIPQGSTLMDFIAELVLGYADLMLSEKLKNVEDFKILRYRDDYRIFTNSPIVAEEIMKHLTETLIDLGLSLNANKTLPSTDLVRSAIKPDKLYWNGQLKYHKSFQKHLLIINELSHRFPNSGSLFIAMKKFLERTSAFKKELNDTKALIGIVVNIAYRNPRVYATATAIISQLISQLEPEEKSRVVQAVLNKFDRLPNTGHLKIWLQRVMLKIDRSFEFNEPLCHKVNDQTVEIWNSEFLNGNIKSIINNTPIVNESAIEQLEVTIQPAEVAAIAYDDPVSAEDNEAMLNMPPEEDLISAEDGGAILNMPQDEDSFSAEDAEAIRNMPPDEELSIPAPEHIGDEEQLPEPHPFPEADHDQLPAPSPEHFDK
jgi:hypothetical protein